MPATVRHSPLDPDERAALGALGVSVDVASRRTSCPDPALLLALEEQVLPPAVQTRVLAHVASCDACRALQSDLTLHVDSSTDEEASGRIAARIAGALRPPRPARSALRWVVGAGIAVAASLAWIAVLWRPAVPDAPSRPAVPVASAAPASVFVPDRPTIASGDITLTVRGESAELPGLADRIAAALDLADGGDRSGAVGTLGAIAREAQDSSDAMLALGATLLAADRTADALAALEQARAALPAGAPAADADEVDWFLAIALVQSGEVGRARDLASGICAHGGPRSARACAGVAELAHGPQGR